MDLQKSLKQAWDILLLKDVAMQAVAKDSSALPVSLGIFAGATVLSKLGTLLIPYSTGMIVYRPSFVDFLVSSVLGIGVGIAMLFLTGLLAERLFHSKLSTEATVRVLGHASLITALGFYQPLNIISGIWYLVVLCTVLTRLGKLQPGSILLLIILDLLLSGVLVGIWFEMMGPSF
jgi:hypothetical protein